VLAADGVANARIAAELAVSADTVRSWRRRFTEEGLTRFGRVRPGRGAKPSIPAETVQAIVAATLHSTPPGHTPWSVRTMAAEFGVSPATVQRIRRARGLKPQVIQKFTPSHDPAFTEKLTDVVGLYLDPPDEKAVVLCMDQTATVQALRRTQPSLPVTTGPGGGTTTLFAALTVLTRLVIGQRLPRHRPEGFLRFLRTIDRQVPQGLAVHLILDQDATHRHPEADDWLNRHPRCYLHIAPTSSSWLNLAERWCGELTDKALRRGSFNSVPDLIGAIEDYPAVSNNPPPFAWTATTASILAKVRSAVDEWPSNKPSTEKETHH